MSWFTDLFSGGAGSVISSIGNVADRFIETDDEKAAFKLEVQRVISARESEIEQTVRSNLQAKERILVAELNQGDNYTKRARPTVVYFGLVMIGVNYLIVPTLSMLNVGEVINFPLPTEFWAAWGGIVATWAVGRSAEKIGIKNKAVQGVTGSKSVGLLD